MNKPNYVNLWMNDLLTKCDPILYPNIYFLLVLLAALPVTNSSAERAFNALKPIQTHCRSTMAENRLNGLAATFIHKNVEIDAKKTRFICTKISATIRFWIIAILSFSCIQCYCLFALLFVLIVLILFFALFMLIYGTTVLILFMLICGTVVFSIHTYWWHYSFVLFVLIYAFFT